MDRATFFDKFDQFADAPDAVAKMRELVLELAVQGKLSEHRAADAKDPAWLKLAQQLDAESGASASDVEPPFEIPSWWRWTTLERLGDTKPRNDAKDGAKSSFVPMTLIPAEYGQSARHEERPWGEIKKGYTHFRNGDVVMAKITPCFENGKSAVMNGLTGGFGAGTTELHVFRRSGEGVLPEFVILYLKTRGFITRGIARMTGSAGQKRVPSDYFARSRFPLPPLGEQKQIVAKVDELMALCDRLESQQQEGEIRRSELARASLARFADAPTPANLNFIFHKSYDIPPADLRKSILTLAVQGKLVPQDPKDEPAEDVLERLNAHKELRIAAKEMRRSRETPTVEEADESYAIPQMWKWCRLGEVGNAIDSAIVDGPFGQSIDVKSDYVASGVPVIRMVNVKPFEFVARNLKFIKPEKFASLKRHNIVPGDVLLGKVGSIGLCAVYPDSMPEGMLSTTGLCRFRVGELIEPRFLCIFLNSIADYLRSIASEAVQPFLNMKTITSIAIPVPPLAEQRRIVAKVEQLMAFVDELETQLAASRATAANLLSSLVAELTKQGFAETTLKSAA